MRLWDHHRQPTLRPLGRCLLCVAPSCLLTLSALQGDTPGGDRPPSPSLPVQAVTQFMHKGTRQRKKPSNKRCSGPTQAALQLYWEGGTHRPLADTTAGPVSLGTHQHNSPSLGHHSAPTPAPGPPHSIQRDPKPQLILSLPDVCTHDTSNNLFIGGVQMTLRAAAFP